VFDCGVCDGIDGYVDGSCYDCAGVPNGLSYLDECGGCDANVNNDCTQDECGVWGGNGVDADSDNICDDVDDCIVQDGVSQECGCNTGIVSGKCDCDGNILDCLNACGGNAVEDNCGVCDTEASNDCEQDDCGIWGGNNLDCYYNIAGVWGLTSFSGTYIRDVAQPTDAAPTSYTLTASWNYAAAVMGADSASADQVMLTFTVGDTLLNTTSALPSDAYLTAAGVAMTVVFNSDDVYTFTGTYPTLRLNEDACETYQTVVQIADQGFYSVVYNSENTGGTLTIAHDASLGGQALSPFDDGVVTITNDGNTLNIQFEDRDAHDVDYAEVIDEWSETENRKTMGIAQKPVESTTGAFAAEGTLSSSGFLMSEQLAVWGGYMTWNALQYHGCFAAAVGTGGDGSSCQTSHGAYLINDSENVFDITCVSDGDPSDCAGKLTYNINGLCIPVNEIILFDSTFERQ
jgi:hypothetical protein